MQWFSLEKALQANGVTKSDVKDVIKKQLENAPKRKGGEKTQMIQIIGLIRPMLITIWNCMMGITFYDWIFGHHEFIFSYGQERKKLKLWGHVIHFFLHKIILKFIVEIG